MRILGEVFAHAIFLAPLFLAISEARSGFQNVGMIQILFGLAIFYGGYCSHLMLVLRKGEDPPAPFLVKTVLRKLVNK